LNVQKSMDSVGPPADVLAHFSHVFSLLCQLHAVFSARLERCLAAFACADLFADVFLEVLRVQIGSRRE